MPHPSLRLIGVGSTAVALALTGFTAGPASAAAGDACTAAPTAIGAVQGTGATTPLNGRTVTVKGTVVGDEPDLNGFFVQDGGDGDAATSDGIFVYAPGAQVDLGDTVGVTGKAQEYQGLTELGGATTAVCADGDASDLPKAARLKIPSDDATRERVEGMLVAPSAQLTVSEVYDLVGFGELELSSGGVLVQPTEVAKPGAAADAVAAKNALRSIALDDGTNARTSRTDRPYLSPTTPVRVGDALRFTAPLVLNYGFGEWQLEPADGTADGTFAPQNTRPKQPDATAGNLHIASFNVLNYFLTRGGVGRGATTGPEFTEQAAKIVSAVNRLGADVVTLEEIEDTDSTGLTPGNADTAVADLVARLNTAAGKGTWDYVRYPKGLYAVPRDVIRNAIIYKPASVKPVGKAVADIDESVWFNAREPIAQTFKADGDTFTVIGNHFKSKGGDGATGDDSDTGQGAFNGDRTREARSLSAFITSLEKSTGDSDVISLGDYNSYTKEDPVELLRRSGLTDLGSTRDPGRYSYVFDALSGSLDHALVTKSMDAKVAGAVHWNIDSVESTAYEYDGDEALYAPNPYRASDHDPLVVGVRLHR